MASSRHKLALLLLKQIFVGVLFIYFTVSLLYNIYSRASRRRFEIRNNRSLVQANQVFEPIMQSFDSKDGAFSDKSSYMYMVYVNPKYVQKFNNESSVWPVLKTTSKYHIKFTSQSARNLSSAFSAGHQINMQPCPEPPGTKMEINKANMTDLDGLSGDVKTGFGGIWRPSNCRAAQKVALIVPYRDRAYMVGPWLRHIHSFLQKQNLEYRIFIVEQDQSYPFNRAMLLNIGTRFAIRTDEFNCLMYHDIDQLPENLNNSYTCSSEPNTVRHYGTYVKCRSWQAYASHFGLVTSLTPAQFLTSNGFSNLYFGWGAEDDDMSTRLRMKGFRIEKKPESVGRYDCLPHHSASKSNDRHKYFRHHEKRVQIEGYNTLMYEVVSFSETPLFTWVFVHINKDDVRSAYHKSIKKNVTKKP